MTMLCTLEHPKVRENNEVGCSADPHGACLLWLRVYSRILYNKQQSLTAFDEEYAAPHLICCSALATRANIGAHAGL